MLTVAILLFSLLFFYFFGYRYYAGRLDREVVQPDPKLKTPAETQYDGVDFVPGKPLVVFGHSFSAIAGAGPIIGPIVAMQHFGWALTLVWILLGNVFIGAVHDYITLMVSVRNRGSSIADIAESTMGYRAKAVFAMFLLMALVLVIAVFGVVAAKTLIAQPEMAFPTFALIPWAMLFGWALYRKNVNLTLSTTVAVTGLVFFLYLGFKFPISLDPGGVLGMSPLMFWFVSLLIYTYFAAVLPVNILLQPRDYLSAFVLFGSMALGLTALFWVHPPLNAPAFLGAFSQEQGPVWPMLFVLVACGAVSGFHSLVVGGTVSKQLASESHGRVIAYGGMLTEGVVAVATVLLVGGGLYWVAPAGENIDMATLGFNESLKAGGWIYAYGNGFGSVVSQMWPWLGFTFASMIAVLALNTFVLTTMDASVRITRFIFEEFLGRKVPILYNKYISTGIITFLVYLVGATEGWQKIWPVFGAANQLIAAMALMVISAYLVGMKKPSHFTLYPAVFMVVTTVAALAWQAYAFLSAPSPNLFLGGTSVVLIALALFVGNEGWQALRGRRVAGLKPVPSEI